MGGRQKSSETAAANGTARALAQGLGWFGVGLGLIEAFTPETLTQALGMKGNEALLRWWGLREIGAGIGVLTGRNPKPWVWGRVAGDALDLISLAPGLDRANPRRGAAAAAFAAVAGAAMLDILCARALGAAPPRRRDYSDRGGMPKPPEAMRGAARQFEVPRDMRTPEALRPYASAAAQPHAG